MMRGSMATFKTNIKGLCCSLVTTGDSSKGEAPRPCTAAQWICRSLWVPVGLQTPGANTFTSDTLQNAPKMSGAKKRGRNNLGGGVGVRQGRSGWVISKGDQVQDRIPETGRAVVARKQQTSKATCSRQGTAQDQAPFTPGQEKVLVFPSAFQKRSIATSGYPFPFNCP